MLLGQGQNVSQVCKQLGVSEQTYDRWRKTYGGKKVGQAKGIVRVNRLEPPIDVFYAVGMRNPCRYFNSSPEVIRLAVMLYIRYPLSAFVASGRRHSVRTWHRHLL